MKDFFLSYSREEKEFVTQVAEALGADRCWLDEWEVSAGSDILEQIDLALSSESIRVFALFWSENSRGSQWVKEEIAQVRIRKLRRNDIQIVPIRMDSSEMPLWMSHIHTLEKGRGAAHIAGELRAALEQTDKLISTRLAPADPAFQNRTVEAEFFESAYKNPNIGCLVINGFPGIGKTALCRFALSRYLPHLRAIWINLDAANSPALFYAALAQRGNIKLPEQILTSGDWNSYWTNWIFPNLDPQSDVLVLDGITAVLTTDDRIPAWLERPLIDCASSTGMHRLPLIMTATRAIEFPAKTESVRTDLFMSTLKDNDVTRCLRILLARCHPKQEASQVQLEKAAEIISGYPLGAQLWAAYAVRVGIPLALLDPSPVRKQVRTLVGDVLAKCGLTKEEKEALLLVALLRLPIAIEELTAKMGVSPTTLINLKRSMLFDPSIADGLAVHRLLGEYLIENIASHDAVRSAHETLGMYFLEKWRQSENDIALTAALGSQAYYHLLSSGKVNDANMVSWSLLEEADKAVRELYRMKQYENVIAITESLSSVRGAELNEWLQFYQALALGRRDASDEDRARAKEIFGRLTAAEPGHKLYWSAYGDLLMKWKENERAKEAFMRARAVAKQGDPVPSMRLGELLLLEDKLDQASKFIEEAYSYAPDDPRVLATYARLLHLKGDNSGALEVLAAGLKRRPDDIPLNHRAGLILREMGAPQRALSHLTRAATGADSPPSYTALADLHLELGQVRAARSVMARYPGKKDGAYWNVMGNIARRQNKFGDAERYLRRSRELSGEDVVYFGSLAHLRLAQAESALEALSYDRAKTYSLEARALVLRGLDLDRDDAILMQLKRDCEKTLLVISDLSSRSG